MRALVACSLFVVVAPLIAAGCLVSPTNGFDPDAPVEAQKPARVEVTVKDTSSNVVTDGVTVSVEGSLGNVSGVRDGDVFVADDVAPGAVTVVVTSAAAGTATRDLTLFAGETRAVTVVVAVDAAQLGTVSGTARKESQVVEAFPDHSGVVVEAFVAGVTTGVRGVTNAEGRYDLPLIAGTYTLAFSAAEHEPQERADVVVAAGAVTDVDSVTLEVNPGSIDGTVALEDLDDSDGAVPSPAGATIALVGAAVTTTAAADGTFRITGLPPGAQSLRFSFDDHESVEVPVVVRAGTTSEIAAVTLLHNRGVIFGTVDVAGAADDSGVLVEADGAGVIDVTGVDGAFSLRVPTGTWDVIASKTGTRRAREDAVVVAAGAAVDVGAFSLVPNVGALVINDDSGLTNDAVVQLHLDPFGAGQGDAVTVRSSEDVTFLTFDEQAYPASGVVPFTLADVDGNHDVFVQVISAAGDIKTLSGAIVLDTTAPTLTDIDLNGAEDLALTTEVSLTVSVTAAGADLMAIATDGVVDSELFTPFAATAVAVLPSGDGTKNVCVIVKDEAGNSAGPLCDDVALETAVPVAPRFTLNGRLVDSVVIPGDVAAGFHVGVVPFGGPNDDVVALEGTIESNDVVEGGVGRNVTVACAPDDDGLIVCDDDDGVDGVFLELFTETQSGQDVRPNLVTFRARDAAGNLSSDSSLAVIVDDTAPLPPTPTNAVCSGADCVARIYAGPLNRVQQPVNVNSDAFTLQVSEQPADLDATFARYFVAVTVGDDVDVDQSDFAPTASVDNIVFALTQGAPLNGAPVTTTCNPLRCVNHLFIVAADLAGNKSPVVRIDVTEDSSPPTRPTLAPRGGLQRGSVAELRLFAPAVDRSGAAGGDEDVFAYEIKEGTDGAFEGVPDGQPVLGPWSLGVLDNDVSEVCVRGVDEAGNVGIEDCVVVEENSRSFPVRTELSDRRVTIGGDRMAAVIDSTVIVHEFADDDVTDGLTAKTALDIGALGNPGLLRSSHFFDAATGKDVFDVVVDFSIENGGAPQWVLFADAQPGLRTVCGRGVSTDGATFVFERSGRLIQATRAQVLALPTTATESGSCTNVGTDLGAINTFCANTAVVVNGANIVWCENNGTIKRKDATSTVTLTTTAAPENFGLFGRSSGPQQPLVSSTATFFAQGSPATLRRVAHGGVVAVDTGVKVGTLGAAEGDRVAYVSVGADGVAADIGFVDLSVSPLTPRLLTDDLAPQSQPCLDGSRVGFVDLSSFSEDVAVVDLSTQRWLAGQPSAETQTAVGDGLVVWIGFDTTLQVLARVDVAAGSREVVVGEVDLSDVANAPFTFVGGTPLGPSTIGAAGKTALLFKNNGNNTWTLNAAAPDSATPSLATVFSDLRTIDATRDASTTAWGASPDGTRLVTVTATQLRLSRMAGATAVDSDNLVAVAAATVVPFVDVEAVGAGSVTVAQIGNNVPVGGGGDERTGNVGDLTCFATDANGVVGASGVVRRGGTPLVGRAPSLALVNNKLVLAYQEVTGGIVRNHACELTCAGVPACANDVRFGANDDSAPTLSRTGLAVSVSGIKSAFGDVALFDVVKKRSLLLTGGGGDRSPRAFVDVNGDRVVWSDARLGNFDLWESVVVH